MLRRAIPLLAALLGAHVQAAPVPPQPKPDDSLAPSAVKLLQQRKIQKELKMTAEQRVAIFDGLADIEEAWEKKLDELARNPNAPEEAFDKLDQEREKATEKLLGDSAAKLTAAQKSRLRQFDWRLRGPAAFTDPAVQKKLQLTDAQKKKAADVAERMKGELERYFENLGAEDMDTQRANLLAFRKERLKEIEGALTADQKGAWANMLGEAPTGFNAEELWLRIEEELDLLGIPVIK